MMGYNACGQEMTVRKQEETKWKQMELQVWA